MIDKIKNLDYQKIIKELRDLRMIGLLVFGVVILLVSWSGIGVIQTNYELQKKISKLKQEVSLMQLENSNLQLRNKYYDTEQFLELEARRQFGKAAPGEKLLIVPKTVALAHTQELPQEPEHVKESLDSAHKPFYQENLEAWLHFLFRRPVN